MAIYSPFTGCEMVHHQTIQLMELSVDGCQLLQVGPATTGSLVVVLLAFRYFWRERLRFCDRDWGMGHWLKTGGWDSCVKLKSL